MNDSLHITDSFHETLESEDKYSPSRDWLSAPRPPARDDVDLDITPMIDITFLLLIFFLVASRMDAAALVELPEARYGDTVTVANSTVLTVVPRGQGVRVFKGEAMDPQHQLPDEAAAQNDEIEDFVLQALRDAIPKQQVIVRAEKQVRHREVARILSAIGRVDGVRAYVAVVEDAD